MKRSLWVGVGVAIATAIALAESSTLAAVSDVPPDALRSPVSDPVITSPYGWRTHPVTGHREWHNGVDLHAPLGTTVYAPGAGLASAPVTTSAGGLELFVDLVNGMRAGFAHLGEILVAPGEAVVAGEPVATIGPCSNCTAPHLHYTLSQGGQHVDPAPYIPVGYA